MSDLNHTEMRLLCLGAALVGVNTEGSKIVAEALAEMQRLRKQAAEADARKPVNGRRKKR